MLGLTPDELIKQAAEALVNKDSAALHQVFDTLKAEGFDANSFLKDLKNALGDLFYFRSARARSRLKAPSRLPRAFRRGFWRRCRAKSIKLLKK